MDAGSGYLENFKKLPAFQKASLLSILFLVILLPIGIILALGPVKLFPKAGSGGPTAPPVPITPPGPNEGVEMMLSPKSFTVAPGGDIEVDLQINKNSQQVTAAEVHMSYDPNFLGEVNVVLSSGIFPVLLENPVVESNGSLSFTVGVRPNEPIGLKTGRVARVFFKAKRELGQSNISLVDSTKVTVAGSNINAIGSPLGFATVNIVNLPTPIPSPQVGSLSFVVKFDGVVASTSAVQKSVTVDLIKDGQTTTRTVVVFGSEQRSFRGSVNGLNSGTYRVFLKAPGFLRRSVGNVTIGSGMIFGNYTATPLLAGDLIENNTVDIFDYNALVGDFGSRMPVGGSVADLNFDGKVDIFDYNLLVGNFDETGD